MTSTRRKIEALREIIKQIEQDLGSILVDDLNSDPVVLGSRGNENKFSFFIQKIISFHFQDIFDKWSRLQISAQERDERLKSNRKQWKHFKRQLDDLEQVAQQFSAADSLRQYFSLVFLSNIESFSFISVPRTVYNKADVHLDQLQRLGSMQKENI